MSETTIATSWRGVPHRAIILKDKQTVQTKAVLMKIQHKNPENDEAALKIGRYNKNKAGLLGGFSASLESSTPKSELTLDDEEFRALLNFIEETYTPLTIGVGHYIKASSNLDVGLAKRLQEVFENKDARSIAEWLCANELLPSDCADIMEFNKRRRAIHEFAEKLEGNEVEYEWQKWFEQNSWVLGNEFVDILDERKIDTENIADYLMKTFDGFVDLIEIKRPEGMLHFWSECDDHSNLVPHQDLIKAVTQVQNYIQELEEEMNSLKMQEKLDGVPIIKPRATLIFGRSHMWGERERRAFRLLNANYINLAILTYDHVLERATRSLSEVSYD